MVYQPRSYRNEHKAKDLFSFSVMVRETDLYISARSDLRKEAESLIKKYRNPLEQYIAKNRIFLLSLEPLPVRDGMPMACRLMTEAAAKVNIGPMSAVAGVIAELVGNDLLKYSPEVIVENGGDIFIKTDKPRIIQIYAGEHSPFRDKLAIEINPDETPLGVCTSSGTIGHSLSFGKADAVTVLSVDTGLADAAATAIGNIIKTPLDFQAAVTFAKTIRGIKGLVLVKDDKFSAWGEVKLC